MGRPLGCNLVSADFERATLDGKPVMVAETGIYAESTADLAPARETIGAKSAQFRAVVVGANSCGPGPSSPITSPPPQWTPTSGISPGDPSLGLLGRAAIPKHDWSRPRPNGCPWRRARYGSSASRGRPGHGIGIAQAVLPNSRYRSTVRSQALFHTRLYPVRLLKFLLISTLNSNHPGSSHPPS